MEPMAIEILTAPVVSHVGRLDAAEQMAFDEAVLTHAPEGEVVLRFYDWKGPGITFGYSQAYRFAEAAAARKSFPEAPLVRRATGGGVVFHDGQDVTFSLVFPWERLSAACLIYKNIHRGIHLGLKARGMPSRLWSGERTVSEPTVCFNRPEPMDLVTEDGAKILGGALRRRMGRGLYQGSFRLEGWPRPAVQDAIIAGLTLEWGRRPVTELAHEWLSAGKDLVSKYRSDAWNRRR
jgi:lipoate-protein ligase A